MPFTIDLSTLAGQVTPSNIGSAIASAVVTFLVLRRKLSKDKLEIQKDRSEINLIDHLETQRDSAIEERDNALAKLSLNESVIRNGEAKIEQLTEQVIQLTSQVGLLRQIIDRLSDTLDATKFELQKIKQMQDSGPSNGSQN